MSHVQPTVVGTLAPSHWVSQTGDSTHAAHLRRFVRSRGLHATAVKRLEQTIQDHCAVPADTFRTKDLCKRCALSSRFLETTGASGLHLNREWQVFPTGLWQERKDSSGRLRWSVASACCAPCAPQRSRRSILLRHVKNTSPCVSTTVSQLHTLPRAQGTTVFHSCPQGQAAD